MRFYNKAKVNVHIANSKNLYNVTGEKRKKALSCAPENQGAVTGINTKVNLNLLHVRTKTSQNQSVKKDQLG